MRRRILILFSAALFMLTISGCSTFEGVAGDPGETYTTRYNNPGDRIVPYNNPHLEDKETPADIHVCEGVSSTKGFQCR